MAKSGLKHIDVGPELTKTEWESEETHELIRGTSFPSSPVERQLFYRDDEHKWYIYNGTDWIWLGGGGMEVHGNEYHDPDFEQEGVAATLVESHRTTEVHTQDQPPAEHGNEKHNPDFATDAALIAHAAATQNTHGAGSNHLALFPVASTVVNRVVWKDSPELAWSVEDGDAFDWTDLDLTPYTSANAKFAIVSVAYSMSDAGDSGNNDFSYRKNGTTAAVPRVRIVGNSNWDWVQISQITILGLDSGQVMERKCSFATGASGAYIYIYVLGYIE